jgi:hypothetical protein
MQKMSQKIVSIIKKTSDVKSKGLKPKQIHDLKKHLWKFRKHPNRIFQETGHAKFENRALNFEKKMDIFLKLERK